jgi:hypothetical protein
MRAPRSGTSPLRGRRAAPPGSRSCARAPPGRGRSRRPPAPRRVPLGARMRRRSRRPRRARSAAEVAVPRPGVTWPVRLARARRRAVRRLVARRREFPRGVLPGVLPCVDEPEPLVWAASLPPLAPLPPPPASSGAADHAPDLVAHGRHRRVMDNALDRGAERLAAARPPGMRRQAQPRPQRSQRTLSGLLPASDSRASPLPSSASGG